MSTHYYLDAASTRPLLPSVRTAMAPWLGPVEDEIARWGNPSASAAHGQRARVAIERSRKRIAEVFSVEAPHIIFTSGATEANNMVILGRFLHHRIHHGDRPFHVISSLLEHSSVIGPLRTIEKLGATIHWIPVDQEGRLSMNHLEQLLEQYPQIDLMTFMWVNNETGTINPIETIAQLAERTRSYLHVDAVQAINVLPIQTITAQKGLSSLAFSAHKAGGPQGSGLLWCRTPQAMQPILSGGGQERERRSGTEAVGLIVGSAEAYSYAQGNLQDHVKELQSSKDRLFQALTEAGIAFKRHGSASETSPSIMNLSFHGQDAQTMVVSLDIHGIEVSTGSACSSGTSEPSRVLLAMDLPEDDLYSSLRLSLYKGLSDQEIQEIVSIFRKVLK